MRTHYCKDIKINTLNKEVEICGWVNNYVHFKKNIFLKVRDITGIIQIIVKSSKEDIFKLSGTIRKEYVVKIIGKVNKRPNKNL